MCGSDQVGAAERARAIQYRTFADAANAIEVQTTEPSLYGQHVGVSVSDSIFRDSCGLYVCGAEYWYPSVSVFNCLFVGGGSAICYDGSAGGDFDLTVTNCTFDGGGSGCAIALYNGDGECDEMYYSIRYNVFSRLTSAVYTHCDQGYHDLDYSGLYQVQTYGPGYGGGATQPGPHFWVASDDPFVANANGSYYLNELPDDTDFRDKGDIGGFDWKATRAATVANGRVKQSDITQSETGTRFAEQFDTEPHNALPLRSPSHRALVILRGNSPQETPSRKALETQHVLDSEFLPACCQG